jgi:hypothetical protein
MLSPLARSLAFGSVVGSTIYGYNRAAQEGKIPEKLFMGVFSSDASKQASSLAVALPTGTLTAVTHYLAKNSTVSASKIVRPLLVTALTLDILGMHCNVNALRILQSQREQLLPYNR